MRRQVTAKAVREFVQQARQRAIASPWTGRTGDRDRLVWLAHLSIAERAGKTVYHASARELSELALTSKDSASRATKKLIGLDYLHLVQKGKHFSEASLYGLKLNSPSFYTCDTHDGEEECINNGKFHGVFESSPGLGKAAQIVYLRLLQGPLKPKEIADKTGRSSSTVYAKLPILCQHGLIQPSPSGKGYVAVEGVDFEELGQKLRTLEIPIRRKQRHQAERAKYEQSTLFGQFHNPLFGHFLLEYYPELSPLSRSPAYRRGATK